jgi:uncharacterized protein YaiE (UPF0345 family)
MGQRIINVKIFSIRQDASITTQEWLEELFEEFLDKYPTTRFRFQNPWDVREDDRQGCIVGRLLVEAEERSISDDHIIDEFDRTVSGYIQNMEFFIPPWADDYVQVSIDETLDYPEKEIEEDIDSIIQEALAQRKRIKNLKPFNIHVEEETLENLLVDWGASIAKEMEPEFESVTVLRKANIFFDGKVTSRTILFADGSKKTLGVMLPGEYEFSTAEKEIMEILSGDLEVRLPGESGWKILKTGELFEVPPESKFALKVHDVTDYCCSYVG